MKISVETYLATSYSPDCDYVDGEVQERNFGEYNHSSLQTAIALYFGMRKKQWGIDVVVEQRVQVSPTRFRIPDVCITLGKPEEQIFRKAPFLCVEVLSPEDRMSRIEAKIDDYLKMGVPHVWVLDPQTRQAYSVTPVTGLREVKDGILRTENPVFEVPLNQLFESA